MEQPRKPLRQRVADRRAGGGQRKINGNTGLWLRRAAIAGNIVQFAGLALLISEMLPFFSGDFTAPADWGRLTGFALVFVAGRVLRSGADIYRAAGRKR